MSSDPTGRILTTVDLPLDALVPHPDNPHSGDVEAVAESLRANGQYRPVVVRPHGDAWFQILAGHTTTDAARTLGWTTIQATVVDADDDTAQRILLADNRTADLGRTDEGLLGELLRARDDLTGTGFTPMDLDDLLADQQRLAAIPTSTRGAKPTLDDHGHPADAPAAERTEPPEDPEPEPWTPDLDRNIATVGGFIHESERATILATAVAATAALILQDPATAARLTGTER